MGNFDQKVNKFIEIFVEQNGYAKVIQGLQNTLLIAVTGLIIGIIVGTLIATVRVLPKYKTLPKVLNGICSFYVALFRGTPMVVQLLVFYLCTTSNHRTENYRSTGSHACIRNQQWCIYIRDYAKWNSICGFRTDGGRSCSWLKLWDKHDENRDSTGSKKIFSRLLEMSLFP